jgi:hypothetical protein
MSSDGTSSLKDWVRMAQWFFTLSDLQQSPWAVRGTPGAATADDMKGGS